MNEVCVGWGYCGCIKGGEPLHVEPFIKPMGASAVDARRLEGLDAGSDFGEKLSVFGVFVTLGFSLGSSLCPLAGNINGDSPQALRPFANFA